MNPLVQAQINRLRGNIHTLQKRHEETLAALADEKELSNQRQRTVLQQRRDRATLEQNEQGFGELQQRVAELEEAQIALREHATKMASLAAALAESLEQ
jgi:hypothetical protein